MSSITLSFWTFPEQLHTKGHWTLRPLRGFLRRLHLPGLWVCLVAQGSPGLISGEEARGGCVWGGAV